MRAPVTLQKSKGGARAARRAAESGVAVRPSPASARSEATPGSRRTCVEITMSAPVERSEPELGLGTVVHTGSGRVQVEFKSAGETRIYATESAPLKRVRFRAGEKVRTSDDQE